MLDEHGNVLYEESAQVGPGQFELAPSNLTVGSPAITAPSLTKNFDAGSLTIASPAIGVPGFGRNLDAGSLTIASPAIGVPGFGRNLDAGSLTIASPAIGVPGFGRNLGAVALTVGSLGLTAPILRLTLKDAVSLTVGSPVFTLPSESATEIAVSFAAGSPSFTAPAIGQKLNAATLNVGSPAFAAPAVGHKLSDAVAVAVGSPTFTAPTFSVAFNAVTLVVGSPSFTASIERVAFTATDKAVASPVLGVAGLSQQQVLTSPSFTVPALSLGGPAMGQQHVLVPTSLAVASPVVSIPGVTSFGPAGIDVASPAIGAPALGQKLSAVSVTVASPAFTLPFESLSEFAVPLAVIGPMFGVAGFVQKQALPGVTLVPASPAIGAPSIGQTNKLLASSLTASPIGLPAISISSFLPVGVVVGSPTMTIPGFSQNHVLPSAITVAVASPSIAAPDEAQNHHLVGTSVTVGSPTIGVASIIGILRFVSFSLTTASPVVGIPVGGATAVSTAEWLTVGSVEMTAPVLVQQGPIPVINIVVGGPAFDLPLLAMPLGWPSANGTSIATRGSPFALVTDTFHVYNLAADGTVWRDGVLTQSGVIANGIEKATSSLMIGDMTTLPMIWAWGSFGWAYYMAGVWVNSPPPNLLFPSAGLATASPAFTAPISKQVHVIPRLGLTVGSPVFPAIGLPGQSPPGTYLIWPSAQTVYDRNNNRWTFGAVNPANASEALVLRNGANPYGTPLYASVIQIGPAVFNYTVGGVGASANQLGWVRTQNGQWYFDNGGTAMVAWPAPPNFPMLQVGITAARPTIGPGAALQRSNVIGITVGPPNIGTCALSFANYVAMQPRGINLGPGSIVVAWPNIGEIHRLGAVNLVVWMPDIGETPLAVALAGNAIGTTDRINPYIDQHAGSALIYRAASGLERAMADVDGFRLTATYAELIVEQWDPYAISSQNLPFLAYAQGVNLWEADWNDEQRRWWVANQWELKQQRGSLLGTTRFVSAVGQRVAHAIVPPAKFMPSKNYTAEERAQYNSRFAQLRLYPYVARVQLPWLCYVSNFRTGIEQKRRYTNNGCFLGPIRKMYPTSADAGGRYTRTATIWDRGVETVITVRTVKEIAIDGTVTTWDEVIVPAKISNHYYAGMPGHWPLKKGHPHTWNKYGIFLGIMDKTASRIIKIPRNGELDATTAKAIYQTIVPDNTYIDVYPEHVATPHPRSARSLYSGVPRGVKPKEFLFNKFLPTSKAFQFLYEVWYIFDYARVPDYRRASVYMGQARFGIHKYTAEIRIDIPIKWRKWYVFNGGFLRGHLHPPDTREIEKCRRAVTASMAVRDTIRIDTIMRRRINTNDSLPCDGSFTVGQYIDA